MKIIKDNNGTPETYSISQIKADHSNVSFRDGLPNSQINPLGYFRVQATTKPIFDTDTQKIVGTTPIKNGAVWEQAWTIVPLSPDELLSLQDRLDITNIKADLQVKNLILAKPVGIENYIDTNVTDLDSAKEVLKILAKAISGVGKLQFRA